MYLYIHRYTRKSHILIQLQDNTVLTLSNCWFADVGMVNRYSTMDFSPDTWEIIEV